MTTKRINAKIKHLGLEIVAGNGYQTFRDLATGDQVGEMVCICYLRQQTLEQWVTTAEGYAKLRDKELPPGPHGGARKGAGRKPRAVPLAAVTLKFDPNTLRRLESLKTSLSCSYPKAVEWLLDRCSCHHKVCGPCNQCDIESDMAFDAGRE
ncbi:hypothetical protein UFOVP1329_26 [uncultured Caudovirales phage]|uniref:Uncharacterized protein n=1 Tax=uncultured Caudovirales phage TaxID=2100421 RepID=A0A6J5R0U4_9CAUD|nr:hypothetical protein UFOVP1150_7 [uncultured Caudovirales phage]CAB4199172.1 hypothetical protein UFOVP1329_26 [uncultured Caudovirales phage]CAB4218326.1 hypothetical protein UFOVP1595_10 [uncultured Caudovirales phage]